MGQKLLRLNLLVVSWLSHLDISNTLVNTLVTIVSCGWVEGRERCWGEGEGNLIITKGENLNSETQFQCVWWWEGFPHNTKQFLNTRWVSKNSTQF